MSNTLVRESADNNCVFCGAGQGPGEFSDFKFEFDKSGQLFAADWAQRRATVPVPKYYNWDFLMAPMKSGALVRGDCFYSIKADVDEENFWVKRYKIVWQ